MFLPLNDFLNAFCFAASFPGLRPAAWDGKLHSQQSASGNVAAICVQ